MNVLMEVLNSWGQFFSLNNLYNAITDPSNLGIIFTLVILEGLLSADNALVLAVMVRHLPEQQQKKALTYGIWGAYFFRFLFIGLGLWLVKIWWIKLLGAAYLLKMAIQYFYATYISKKDEDHDGVPDAIQRSFWMTVAQIELMDLAFSADSILAAFGVSNEVWVLFLGGALGILMMRSVARLFVALLEKYPELETAAYILIFIIGVKMAAGAFGYEIHSILFFGLLVAVFVGTFVIHYLFGNKKDESDKAASEIAAAKEKK
jgi:YkoY family integral membrane protein